MDKRKHWITILNAAALRNQLFPRKESVSNTWDCVCSRDLSPWRPPLRSRGPLCSSCLKLMTFPALATRGEASSVSCSDLHVGATSYGFEINEPEPSRSPEQQNHHFLIDLQAEAGGRCPLPFPPLPSLEDEWGTAKETCFPEGHKNVLGSHHVSSFPYNDDKPLSETWLHSWLRALFFARVFLLNLHNSSRGKYQSDARDTEAYKK